MAAQRTAREVTLLRLFDATDRQTVVAQVGEPAISDSHTDLYGCVADSPNPRPPLASDAQHRQPARVRTFPLIALSLLSCQAVAPIVKSPLEEKLHNRALALATAMEQRDTATGMNYAAPSARGFFAAQLELQQLQWSEPEPRPPAAVAIKSVRVADTHGIAVVTMTRDDDSQNLTLHFELADNLWGVVGFQVGDDPEPKRFADLEANLRERIATVIADATPHAELGPPVTAYMTAAGNQDPVAMMADMTADCQRAQSNEDSITQSFVTARCKVQRWQFAKHKVTGTTGQQRIHTLLELPDGTTNSQSMRFDFRLTNDGWVITAVR